jgi:HD-like signal output (HDOD) protein
LSDEQLTDLSATLQIKKAKPNDRIISAGDSGSYSLYLIKGEAISRQRDGTTSLVVAEQDGFLQPVAQLRPSMYDIEAVSTVEYIEIDSNQLNNLSRDADDDMGVFEVETIDHGAEANQLAMQLFQDIIAGNISLPAMPDVAFKIQRAFADDNYNATTIRELIQSDPALSAKILRSANSALYRGNVAIESLQQAIVRMGMDTVRKQVLVYAATELFQAKTSAMKTRMRKLWAECRRVAAFSRVLALRLPRFDAESAQIAGLLSDLGSVAILQYAQENSDLYDNEKALNLTLAALRSHTSAMLLQNWNLGEELIKVSEGSHDWFRNDAEEAALCDLVLVAR